MGKYGQNIDFAHVTNLAQALRRLTNLGGGYATKMLALAPVLKFNKGMRLVILGSGTSVPHRTRSSSGYWLETAGGSILLDCSAAVIHRIAQEGLDWPNLDAIWISHFHLDHCGGLAPLLFGTKYAAETQTRKKPLRIFGPPGLKKLFDAFDSANSYALLKQPFSVELIEIDALKSFSLTGEVEAVAFKSPHTPESHAIHIRDGRETLVYSSDTGYSEELCALARRVSLFVLECSFVRNKPVDIHLELAEAVAMIRRAEPRLSLLSHLYPEWDSVDFNEELTKFSPGFEIVQAYDGMQIDLSDDRIEK